MGLKNQLRVGLLGDTHGLLRPEARAFLRGCDYIVHSGDIGAPSILEQLDALAPVIAVRGNIDDQPWAAHLPETELIRMGGVFLYILHDLSTLKSADIAPGVRVVVYGHSHQPLIHERAGVIFINPGSCGPSRFKLPIGIGELIINGSEVRARMVELQVH